MFHVKQSQPQVRKAHPKQLRPPHTSLPCLNAYLRMSRFNKYSARPEVVDGHRFHSQREAKRYRELKLLVLAGAITGLTLQPKYTLGVDDHPILLKSQGYPNGRRAAYFADFKYTDALSGDEVIEDVKGMDTPLSRLKRAIVEAQYDVIIVII